MSLTSATKLYYSDHFAFPLPEGDTFPMEKYALLRKKIMEAGIAGSEDLRVADAACKEDVLRVHTPEYLHRFLTGDLSLKEMWKMGFPWSRDRRGKPRTLSLVKPGKAGNIELWDVYGAVREGPCQRVFHLTRGISIFSL